MATNKGNYPQSHGISSNLMVQNTNVIHVQWHKTERQNIPEPQNVRWGFIFYFINNMKLITVIYDYTILSNLHK